MSKKTTDNQEEEKKTMEQRVLLEEPPRGLSLFTRLSLPFMGWNCQLGWLLTGLTILGLAYGLSNSDLRDIFRSESDWLATEGQLLEIESIGGRLSRSKVYGYSFSYRVAGQKLYAQAFFESKLRYDSLPQSVSVEYLASNPKRARIEGLRAERYNTRIGFLMLLGGLIPLFLFSLTLNEHRRNLKILRLYRFGLFTRGVLQGKEELGLTVQKKQVYCYTFTFLDEQGQEHKAYSKTANGASIEDEEEEIILYNKQNPEEHILFDEVLSGLDIAPDGHLSQAPGTYIFYFCIPLAVFAAFIWAIQSVL